MRCINCNSEVEDDAKFCRYCGSELDRIVHDKNEEKKKDNSLEERCIKAYVGENKYDSFFRPFNVFAFFLGPIYLLYRKMYLYTFLYFVILFVASFFAIFANLVLAFIVNNMYLSKAKTDVRNIIRVNKNKTDEEIIDLCIKHGGTSFTAVILYLVIISVLSALSWWGINKIVEYDKKTTLDNDYTLENELKYKVPSGFTKNSDNNYSSYNDNHHCYIYISKSYKESYLTETEYIERRYSNKNIEKKVINNNTWYLYVDNYVSTKSNNFINISGNDVFIVRYHTYKDDDKYCSKSLDEFSSSLKIVDKSGALA